MGGHADREALIHTALHEAGHTVAAELLGIRYSYVTARRRAGGDPHLLIVSGVEPLERAAAAGRFWKSERERAKRLMIVFMAGMIAEGDRFPDLDEERWLWVVANSSDGEA